MSTSVVFSARNGKPCLLEKIENNKYAIRYKRNLLEMRSLNEYELWGSFLQLRMYLFVFFFSISDNTVAQKSFALENKEAYPAVSGL